MNRPAGRTGPVEGALAAQTEDRSTSPVTGWTRDHHVAVADASLLALRPWASAGRARFAPPGPHARAGAASDGLEGWARSFLAAGFLLGDPAQADPHDHAGFYADGLSAGTDPAAADRWPRMTEVRQARVEAAAVAIGLHESRARIWDRLDGGVQERVVDWLSESLGEPYGDNNWRWFQNVTQAFLRTVDGPYDQDGIDANLAYLDGCYLGDGWYSDGRPGGRSGNVDWYNAWVMHLFSLWYGRILGDLAPAGLLDAYRERLAAFLPQGARLFGSDGAPLFQGRSLVYRFATTGAFWAGPVFGVDTVPAGTVRRIGSSALRYFLEHGAYDEQGLLGLGWHGRFEPMRQPYSGTGSPYWANLGFAGLVLPASHPVWSEVETQPEADGVRAAVPVGWLVGRHQGIVRVVNHGVDHSGPEPAAEDPQYCRFGYSSATAPVPAPMGISGDEVAVAADNQVTLLTADGRWSHRRPLQLTMITDHTAASRHTARFAREDGGFDDGPEISVWSVLRGPTEVRVVRVGAHGPTARLAISGFALPERSGLGLHATVMPLLGAFDVQYGYFLDVSNPFGADLRVPSVQSREAVVPGTVYAAAVTVSRDADPALPAARLTGATLTVLWPDGESDELVLD